MFCPPYASSLHAFVSPLRFCLVCVSSSGARPLRVASLDVGRVLSRRDAPVLRFPQSIFRYEGRESVPSSRCAVAIVSQPHALSVVTARAVPCRPSPKSCAGAISHPPLYIPPVVPCRRRPEAVSAPVHFSLIFRSGAVSLRAQSVPRLLSAPSTCRSLLSLAVGLRCTRAAVASPTLRYFCLLLRSPRSTRSKKLLVSAVGLLYQ